METDIRTFGLFGLTDRKVDFGPIKTALAAKEGVEVLGASRHILTFKTTPKIALEIAAEYKETMLVEESQPVYPAAA